MKLVEDIINILSEESSDISKGIIDTVNYYDDILISLPSEILNQIIIRLSGNMQEENVWDKLLSIMLPDKISDEAIEYLIQNKIAIMRLCHMDLKDKWLIKLIAYDDAPLYKLAERYYLLNKYSSYEFVNFYRKHLCNRHDISLYLLEIYNNVEKRELLLYLCFQNDKFEAKNKLEWHLVANQIKTMIDKNAIIDIYSKYKNSDIIMLSIANNLFTPEDILLELSSIKGVTNAACIRKASRETLRLKKA